MYIGMSVLPMVPKISPTFSQHSCDEVRFTKVHRPHSGRTSKWANWDPPRPIHVGDYGMINNETGEFDWEGNVYTTTNDIGIDMTDPALTPIEQEGGDDKFIVKSWGVTTKEVNASAEAAVAGAVDVALKVEFQFDGRKPAAALVMYKPRYISLPNDERVIKLLKFRPDVLGK